MGVGPGQGGRIKFQYFLILTYVKIETLRVQVPCTELKNLDLLQSSVFMKLGTFRVCRKIDFFLDLLSHQIVKLPQKIV